MDEECAQCGKKGDAKFPRCTGCWTIRYCSRDCQRRHWPCHKVNCVKRSTTSTSRRKEEETATLQVDPCQSEGEKQEQDATCKVDLAEEGGHDLKTCQNCKVKKRDTKRCGRCLDVTYCSRDCQKADWLSHKVTCQPSEVVTTDGYRETVRREQAGQRRSQLTGNPWVDNVLGTAASDSARGVISWEEARARATSLFPFRRIVDDFNDLGNDFNPFLGPGFVDSGMQDVVAVFRLTTQHYHFFRPARRVQDVSGDTLYVIFYNGCPPWPFFSYHQLREGNFICIVDAFVHLFADGSFGFRVDDPSTVRIMEPRS